MHEQERYMKVLQKIIDEAEEEKIKTSDELMNTLIYELKNIVSRSNRHDDLISPSFTN